MSGWPPDPVLLGSAVARVDGPAKVTGRARYTSDQRPAGLLVGRILRSPHPRARIVRIDLERAREAPGVRAVLAVASEGDEALYQGWEVAALAADTAERAGDALRLIRVEYEPLPHLATVEQALRESAPRVFEGGNVTEASGEQAGDLEAGWKAAVKRIEASYATQVQTHCCLEPHGAGCAWDGDRLTAWLSTQAVHGSREQLAQALGIPQASVRVVTEHIGGGFGSKFGPDVQGVVCARLARLAGAPVRLMLDRKEEQLVTGNRPSAHARVRAGVAPDGRVTAFEADTWGTGGAGAPAGFPLPYVYEIANRSRRHRDVYINAGTQRAMRAPGHPQGCFVTEMVMDELADALGMDPVALRLRNLPDEAANARWKTYFPIGAERIGWNRRRPPGATPGPVKTGYGCAANRWGGGGRGTHAQVEILPDGGVTVRCGTQDLGTGTRTIVALVAAETLGLPAGAVRAEIGDSLYPYSGGSGGSTTAASVAPAIRVAALRALEALAARLAPIIGVPPDALAARNGRIEPREAPAKGLAWRDACRLLGTEPVTVEGEWQAGLSSSGSSGVQFARVAVDVETGVVRVERVACVQDCGLVLDRLTAESQCHGGIVMGIGYALFEERILDRNTGQMVNPDLEFYLLPGPSDIPEIDLQLLDQPERGVIGLGEPPVISTAAAIANAVANAIGVRVRSLPLTPKRVLDALAAAERARSREEGT